MPSSESVLKCASCYDVFFFPVGDTSRGGSQLPRSTSPGKATSRLVLSLGSNIGFLLSPSQNIKKIQQQADAGTERYRLQLSDGERYQPCQCPGLVGVAYSSYY